MRTSHASTSRRTDDASPSLAELLDRATTTLAPFERSVLRLRYDLGHGVRRTAESTRSTQEDVNAALMRAYRAIASALER